MRTGEIGPGPLFPPHGTSGRRAIRRIRGIGAEVVGFIVITLLFPVLFLAAICADLFLWLKRRKPWVGVRLVPFLWWFLATEMWAQSMILSIWVISGGPFKRDSIRRRRGVYWLRPRWARSHLGAIKLLFGLNFEIEGREVASPGPILMMIRHASIIDNMLPDTQVALPLGIGIRYVVKRELEAMPVIDIGGRWIPTQFLQRASADPQTEIATMQRLTESLGSSEAVLIYPEGTRATAKKIARAKEIVREKQPDVAPLAETMVNLLPPRLGGPLALLEEGAGIDVVFFAHAGFDGFQYISDIWAGRLVGQTIRMKLWRVPADEIPKGERERTEWLYAQWQEMDRWVGKQRAELGIGDSGAKAGGGVGSPA